MTDHDADPLNSLKAILSHADGTPERIRHRETATIVSGALSRVRSRRQRRRARHAALVVACVLGLGAIFPRWGNRQRQLTIAGDALPAQWKRDLATLNARADRIAARLTALRRNRDVPDPAMRHDPLEATVAEQRNRAAYTLVRSGERLAASGSRADVSAAYQQAAKVFPGTPWGAEARKRLETLR